MEVRFLHTNINVTDLDRSVAFYGEALGLVEMRRRVAEDGSYQIVFLGDGQTDYQLELTWLANHPQPYELGDNETHIAFSVDDYKAAHKRHEEMDCICYENTKMGLYFIHDPDDYWLEILPKNRNK